MEDSHSTDDRSPPTNSPRRRFQNLKSRGLILTSLVVFIAFVAIAFVTIAVWLFRLDRDIKTRFAEKRFAPPVEFYSAPETIRGGSTFPAGYFESLLKRKNFRARDFGQPIQPGDYSVWTGEQCLSVVTLPQPAATPPPAPSENLDPAAAPAPAPTTPVVSRCLAFRNSSPASVSASEIAATPTANATSEVQVIAMDSPTHVSAVFAGPQPQVTTAVSVEPELFAQYYGDKPVLRQVVNLGAAPALCLNALLAIEDSAFLEHGGISVTGLARAVYTNLRSGRRAQGGSTITQQLVKNYFLTDEKTLSRKFTEIAMAVLVERHATKDDILETYINLIYMGQNGPFQVRGFAAASEHYFGRPLSDLSLDQCAMLAAVLNSPGLYNPFTSPERALARRSRVLDRMLELKMIDDETAKQAKAAPLPTRPQRSLTEPAPYFVQAVRREITNQKIDETEGLRVYTTLSLRAQESAHQSIRSGLDRLEKNYPNLAKLKAAGKNLEAVIVSSDPRSGAVEALVGGRGYLATQFNRAIDSRRQIGSVMKPIVYLTALENQGPDGKPMTPLSPLKDDPTTIRYEGQSWTPKNYEGNFNGTVPMFFSLKESLNVATANLAMQTGLTNIIDTSRRLGVVSKINPVPALALGAFELSPMEVLQAYGTLAQLGAKTPLTLVTHIDGLDGKVLYKYEGKPEQVVAPETTAELVGIMKQTLLTGTGRSARLNGFTHPAAGKTGTTNDKKDAWFAGFTPYHAAIVWVGYDDNTSHNLTGGSGAVPIWTQYMKAYGASFPPDDFAWPAGVDKVLLSPEQQQAFGVPSKGEALPEPVELIFKKGESPLAPSPTPSNSWFGN